MPVEGADDRAVFVAPDEFGVAAVYQPAAGDPVALDGIFDNDASRGFADPGLASSAPRFICPASALPAGASPDDRLSIAGASYWVRVIDPDGTGMATLTLEAED